jgi:Putative phage abortive infection protein
VAEPVAGLFCSRHRTCAKTVALPVPCNGLQWRWLALPLERTLNHLLDLKMSRRTAGKNEKPPASAFVWWIVGGVVALYLLTVGGFALNFRLHPLSNDPAGWGQFGDYIAGILNPILALVSAILIALTLRSQRVAAKRQAFENQFFALLQLHGQMIAGIDIVSPASDEKYPSLTQRGRDCFKWFYSRTKEYAVSKKISINEAFLKWYLEERGWEVEHYYRSVYHLFKYVDEVGDHAELSSESKKRYFDLIKTQISRYELALLYLHPDTKRMGSWPNMVRDPLCDPFEHLDHSLVK